MPSAGAVSSRPSFWSIAKLRVVLAPRAVTSATVARRKPRERSIAVPQESSRMVFEKYPAPWIGRFFADVERAELRNSTGGT